MRPVSAECNYCHEPIVWGQTTPGGKPIPLDPEPTTAGNCERRGETRGGGPLVRVLTKDEVSTPPMFAEQRYMPHHATCSALPENAGKPRTATAARARAGDPETSHAAARDATSRIRESQNEVLSILRTYGPLADVQLIARARQHGVRQSESGLRTRRAELVAAGLVIAVGQVKVGRRSHTTWRVVD